MGCKMNRLWLNILSCVFILTACGGTKADLPASLTQTVADTPTQAQIKDGQYISWAEHIIDGEDINGGVPIRGGDGIAIGDLDRDGYADIITAQEDSNHLRIAFGSPDPHIWDNRTLAQGALVGAIEDVTLGDFNGDGWLDIVAACEEAHLAYFENPADKSQTREQIWASLILPLSQGRGSWLRAFAADINGDGQIDLTAANKGAADIARTVNLTPGSGATSLITLHGPPLRPSSWREQVLYKEGVPNTALPFDIDGDGDLDVLAAKRLKQEIIIIENLSTQDNGSLRTQSHPVKIIPSFDAPPKWRALVNAFHADFADMNGDGRIDLVLNGVESTGEKPVLGGLGWLEQPENLEQAWRFHRIGNILPDWVTGIHLSDLDGDGDLDVMTGGYSGVNILSWSYSGASRDYDDPSVTPAASTGRLSWFENLGNAKDWTRHDMSRRVRGMYDMFVTRDMDGDGDLDIIAPRGNSGAYDGVFWLEQIRSETPRPAFTPARANESRHLPLPPDNWLEMYDRTETYVAPNKTPETE